MCESNAYMRRGDDEELLLSEVARIEPLEEGFRLYGLFGEQVEVKGRIDEVNLLKHKILFIEE